MDPRIVQRVLQRDPEAIRELEQELKAIAGRLLEHPLLGIDEPVTLRVLTNAAVAEAMSRGGRDLDTFLAGTIMAAARRGVEHMRRDEGGDGNVGHIPAGILVSAALVPHVMATASRDAAEQHLARCADCTHELKVVREATTVATELAPDEDPEEPTQEVSWQPGQSTMGVAAEDTVEPAAAHEPLEDDEDPEEPSLQAIARQTLDSMTDMSKLKPVTAPPRRGLRRVMDSRRGGRAAAPPPAGGERGLGVVGLLLVFSQLVPECHWERELVRDESLAELSSRQAPAVPPRSSWQEGTQGAYLALEQGNCSRAAVRFRRQRKRQPEEAALWYWEGVTFLCAGRSEQAQQALLQAGQLADEEPPLPDLAWYQAQTALALGHLEEARIQLGGVCGTGSSFGGQACKQLTELESRNTPGF